MSGIEQVCRSFESNLIVNQEIMDEKEGNEKERSKKGMIGKATGKSELSSRSTPPPVQGLIHSAQHDLQDGISREAVPIIHRLPANRIDHIPDAEPPSQGVVERSRPSVAVSPFPHLEELHADLSVWFLRAI